MTYAVQYGDPETPSRVSAETLSGATRIAMAFIRDKRPNVGVRLPDGTLMEFQSFQGALSRGELRDSATIG